MITTDLHQLVTAIIDALYRHDVVVAERYAQLARGIAQDAKDRYQCKLACWCNMLLRLDCDVHPASHTKQIATLKLCRDLIIDMLDAVTAELCVKLIDRFVDRLPNNREHLEQHALARWCKGLWLLNREMYPALEHLNEAYKYYHSQKRTAEQGRLLIGRAGLLGQLGRLEDALDAITQAEPLITSSPKHRNRLPSLLINRSDIEGRLGHYDAMLQTAQRAEKLARDYNRPTTAIKALINQAFAALFLGMFSQAEILLNKAQAEAQSYRSPELTARVAINQARLKTYRDELAAALRLLQQARADFRLAKIEIDEATVEIEEASVYERLYSLYEAQRAARQAASTFRRAGLFTESIEASLIAIRISLDLEETGTARRALADAQKLELQATISPVLKAMLVAYAAHPLFQSNRAARITALHRADAAAADLATLAGSNEYLQTALIAADLAAALHQASVRTRYEQVIAAAQSARLPAIEQRAKERLAETLPAQEALGRLREAAKLAADLHRQMPIEELKASYLSGLAPLYGRLIAAYLESESPEAALDTLLEAKGRIWTELTTPSTIPPLNPAWVRAKTEVMFWQEKKAQAVEPRYVALCNDHLRKAESELVAAARSQMRERMSQPIPDLKMVREHLPVQSVAVEYLVGSTNIRACVVTVDEAQSPIWFTLCPTAAIEDALGKFVRLRLALQAIPTPERRRVAAEGQLQIVSDLLTKFYDLLIAPLEPLLRQKQVIIAPDDFLFSVPWASLRSAKSYLGQQFVLVLVPSLVVFALPMQAVEVGPPRALGNPGNPPLTHIDRELAAIKRSFPETFCVNCAQTIDLRWTTAPRFLHIAAHARINNRTPLLSRLELADAPLLLAEAFNLPLRGTTLVTLSACDTGVIPERGGVTLALAGAFLIAGAQAAIASLWQVDDEATCLLMEHLYAGLNKGLSLPLAVQQAQELVRANGYAHPFYWAAFQPLLHGWPVRIVQDAEHVV
jgi:CHAT domain-containing protein/tetratricopeptide (TPR) repeat protein